VFVPYQKAAEAGNAPVSQKIQVEDFFGEDPETDNNVENCKGTKMPRLLS
jgi:hypothetical protein